VALWAVLRSLDYGSVRVAVYGALARGAEAFLHPAWAALLFGLAALLFLVARKRSVPLAVPAAVAPAVQLRAEPPGMISVVIAGSRDAVARDSVLERNPLEEERVVEAFHALAQRSASFAGANESGGFSRAQIDEAQRELYALGLTIGSTLLGGSSEVADALVDLPGDHLQLGVQTELAGIPWELMVARRGGEFLWQLFSVTRQLRDPAAVRPKSARRGGRCRLLLLANLEAGVPGRELPAAEREAGQSSSRTESRRRPSSSRTGAGRIRPAGVRAWPTQRAPSCWQEFPPTFVLSPSCTTQVAPSSASRSTGRFLGERRWAAP
jgi:hypothetical protein